MPHWRCGTVTGRAADLLESASPHRNRVRPRMSGSGRKKMSVMARGGDEEGIARLLAEGVDPAAPEECDVSEWEGGV
jgi:hypothetical protein